MPSKQPRFVAKPTMFKTTIQGQEYKFAALTQKDMERLNKKEQAAREANDSEAAKVAHWEVVSLALTRGGTEVSVDDVAEMDLPLYLALFRAIIEAHGVTLDASKVGEVQASANS
jgi:uncharacterized membrane-anchored protein